MRRVLISSMAVALAMGAFAFGAAAQTITILGGSVKGQPYQFAVGLSKMLKEKTDIVATPQSAKGMVAQARIIAAGQADFAWGLGGPVGAWAYKGERRFEEEGPKENLRAVLAYPFGEFQWLALAESGIEHLSDLKGKRVSVGSAASTTQTFARFFLPAHGLGEGGYDERTPGFAGGFNALRDGTVDAHLTVGLAPLGAVQELAALKKIRLIEMDPDALNTVIEKYGPGLVLTRIGPDTYGGNQVNTAPVNVLSIHFGFSTGEAVSDDVVYTVTRTLFENIEEFHGVAKAASNVTLEGACDGLAFPLHAGAKRYYQEVGQDSCL